MKQNVETQLLLVSTRAISNHRYTLHKHTGFSISFCKQIKWLTPVSLVVAVCMVGDRMARKHGIDVTDAEFCTECVLDSLVVANCVSDPLALVETVGYAGLTNGMIYNCLCAVFFLSL